MSTEIETRIRRIYAAIGEAASTDGRHLVPSTQRLEEDLFETRIDFESGQDIDRAQNVVYGAIHNIANIKDHLKRWARQNGKDSDVIQRAVDSSLELRVIIDLSNRDKHGPLRDGDPGYSRLGPDLIGFRQVLTLSPQGRGYRESGSFTVEFFGEFPNVQFDGTCLRTSADIIDRSGQRIGDAMDFMMAAVTEWEDVLAAYGLRLNP